MTGAKCIDSRVILKPAFRLSNAKPNARLNDPSNHDLPNTHQEAMELTSYATPLASRRCLAATRAKFDRLQCFYLITVHFETHSCSHFMKTLVAGGSGI